MIRRVVKVGTGLLAALILLLALAVGAGIFLNGRAERRAAEFCAATAIASKLSEVVERANRLEIRHYPSQDHQIEAFMFPGWVFNRAECHVKANEGIVTSKWVTEAQD